MKHIPIKIDSQFLIRVIKNEVDADEQKYFEQWLTESEENKEEFGSLVLLWLEMGEAKKPDIPDANVQWDVIAKKINSQSFQPMSESSADFKPLHSGFKFNSVSEKSKSFYNQNSIWIMRIAAVIILTVGFSYIYSFLISNKNSAPVKEKQLVQNPVNVMYEKTVVKGERITFPLSDGSIVYLNSDSKLIYPRYFSDNERKLELVGEAYFSVKPDINKPFKVVCGNMTVVVTGTEFNIRNRNNKIKVVVAKGSVLTFSDKTPNGVSLQKGEMVSLERNGSISRPVKVNLAEYLAWRQNKLSFSQTSLFEVMKEIERYYNIETKFVIDSLKNRSLTGVFQTDNTSLDEILNIISLTLDIKIIHDNNKILVQ